MKNKIELITFSNEDFSLEVKLDVNQETVWLSQNEMAKLFNVSTDNIGLHIKKILNDGELNISTTEDFSVVRKEGTRNVKRTIKIKRTVAKYATVLFILLNHDYILII